MCDIVGSRPGSRLPKFTKAAVVTIDAAYSVPCPSMPEISRTYSVVNSHYQINLNLTAYLIYNTLLMFTSLLVNSMDFIFTSIKYCCDELVVMFRI